MADLFDIVVARKLSGGGSGGGSSDFSMATVTVTNGSASDVGLGGAFTMDVPGFGAFTIGQMGVEASATLTTQIILYKGQGVASFSGGTVTASGDAQPMGGGAFLVSGDCTFTVS